MAALDSRRIDRADRRERRGAPDNEQLGAAALRLLRGKPGGVDRRRAALLHRAGRRRRDGRSQVRNAAILYGAVALGVVWLWSAGRLLPWGEPFGVAGTALTALGLGVWFVYHMAWRAASPAAFDPADDGQDMPAPARVVISPRQGFYPLVDSDTGQRFSHMYWYDGTLGWRIEDWDDVFQEAFTLEDVPQGPDFASPEAEAAWRAEGLAIAEALKEILGPENVGFAGGWETGQGADA